MAFFVLLQWLWYPVEFTFTLSTTLDQTGRSRLEFTCHLWLRGCSECCTSSSETCWRLSWRITSLCPLGPPGPSSSWPLWYHARPVWPHTSGGMYCTHNASANWVPDVGHKAQVEEAGYCFLKGAHLRDEDFPLHHKVEDNFPENKKKTSYQQSYLKKCNF